MSSLDELPDRIFRQLRQHRGEKSFLHSSMVLNISKRVKYKNKIC